MNKVITSQCKIKTKPRSTVIHEDNAACIFQVGVEFIKADRIKHINLQIFSFTQELIQAREIDVKKIQSRHNVADMLTKAMPAYTHRRLIQAVDMRSLHEIAQ